MINKKGDEKYYIIISLIMGLIILGISLYFIFNEFFTGEDVDWEICRQSVVLRDAVLSQADTAGGKWALESLLKFPFKCKTKVVEIDYEDYDKAGKQIMDEMASCWALYGEGKATLYTPKILGSGQRSCFYCARIHFDEGVRKYYSPKTSITALINENRKEYNQLFEKYQKINDDEHDLVGFVDYIKEISKGSQGWNELEEDYSFGNLTWNKTNGFSQTISSWGTEQDNLMKVYEEKLIKLNEAVQVIRGSGSGGDKFHWNNYLSTSFNKKQTYGQYFYGWISNTVILGDNGFEKAFGGSGSVGEEFDANNGDLMILFYDKGWTTRTYLDLAFILPVTMLDLTGVYSGGDKDYYQWVIAHQTDQQPKCDVIETIPA